MSGCFRNEKRLHLEPNLEALRRMDVPYGAMEAREARFIVRQCTSIVMEARRQHCLGHFKQIQVAAL